MAVPLSNFLVKKFKSETPSKMTQIIKRNHKKHNYFFIFFNISFLRFAGKAKFFELNGYQSIKLDNIPFQNQ